MESDAESVNPSPVAPVAGIVLAAGRSSRMGAPKALMAVEGKSFLEHAVRVLREGGCEPVVVVLSAAGEPRQRVLASAAGALVVENPDPGAEQIASLRLGLDLLGGEVAAAMVMPVDHPLTSRETVAALIAAFDARGAPIVRPVFQEQPGHPVLFARSVWPELAEPDLDEGAREILQRHHPDIENVPVDDHGVTVDIDTPADYARDVPEK